MYKVLHTHPPPSIISFLPTHILVFLILKYKHNKTYFKLYPLKSVSQFRLNLELLYSLLFRTFRWAIILIINNHYLFLSVLSFDNSSPSTIMLLWTFEGFSGHQVTSIKIDFSIFKSKEILLRNSFVQTGLYCMYEWDQKFKNSLNFVVQTKCTYRINSILPISNYLFFLNKYYRFFLL